MGTDAPGGSESPPKTSGELRDQIARLEDDLRDELVAWEWEGPNPSSAPDDLIATILGVFKPALEQAQARLDEQTAEIARLREELDSYQQVLTDTESALHDAEITAKRAVEDALDIHKGHFREDCGDDCYGTDVGQPGQTDG